MKGLRIGMNDFWKTVGTGSTAHLFCGARSFSPCLISVNN